MSIHQKMHRCEHSKKWFAHEAIDIHGLFLRRPDAPTYRNHRGAETRSQENHNVHEHIEPLHILLFAQYKHMHACTPHMREKKNSKGRTDDENEDDITRK